MPNKPLVPTADCIGRSSRAFREVRTHRVGGGTASRWAEYRTMFCENCHQREATCHVTTIKDGVLTSRHFCIECHEATSPEAREFSAAQRNARCDYCGGQPCAGGTDFLKLVTGIQKLKFMCTPCSIEHNRFVQEQLQEDGSGLSQQEQLALLRKSDRDADEHLRLWISERRSR